MLLGPASHPTDGMSGYLMQAWEIAKRIREKKTFNRFTATWTEAARKLVSLFPLCPYCLFPDIWLILEMHNLTRHPHVWIGSWVISTLDKNGNRRHFFTLSQVWIECHHIKVTAAVAQRWTKSDLNPLSNVSLQPLLNPHDLLLPASYLWRNPRHQSYWFWRDD